MYNNNLFRLTQLQFLEALNKGKTIRIIDHTGEYATLAKKLGGKTFVIDENDQIIKPLNIEIMKD